MSVRKDKLIRKTVRRDVGDHSRRYLIAMLDCPFLTRLRWAAIIVLRLGYRDLVGGDIGIKRETSD